MDPKASRELSRGAVRTARSLCVRLHSLGYCLTQLTVLSHLIDERWQGVQRRRAAYGREARALPRTVLHAGAPEAVMATVDELCRFIGAKARRRPPHPHAVALHDAGTRPIPILQPSPPLVSACSGRDLALISRPDPPISTGGARGPAWSNARRALPARGGAFRRL